MPCYRLFYRDPASGRFLDSVVLEACADDREALQRLADHVRPGDVELWERDRLVAILRSMPEAA